MNRMEQFTVAASLMLANACTLSIMADGTGYEVAVAIVATVLLGVSLTLLIVGVKDRQGRE